jgi:membrane protease YdiL (CAAX protease family)
MSHIVLPFLFIALVYGAMIVLNERYGLFSVDRFQNEITKLAAYIWLAILLFGLTFLIVGSARHTPTAQDLARTPFYSLFTLHAILIVFLAGWWLLSDRPPLREFLNLGGGRSGEMVMTGLAVGIGGWIFTLVIAFLLVAILNATGLLPAPAQPPPMIAWMAALPLWKKALIVLSAMTVEEAFFRGWLQKRVGLLASTVLFALAHSGFGQPFLLIGVAMISLIIGFTFYRTKNLLPGVIAHGVFDAVQLFVVIPIVFRAMGLG